MSKTWRTSAFRNAVQATDSILGVLGGQELDIGVHGLCSGSFHDDVNGTTDLGWKKTRMAAEKLHDFLLRD
jgi:hypothetical protein